MRRKTIPIPGTHDVHTGPIQAIIDTPRFQRLQRIHQLGMSYLRFPSAHHTRFEHLLGCYSLTRERVERLRTYNCCTADEGRDLVLYALIHDIGHGAYSHELDDLCSTDHNAHGAQVLQAELRTAIEACGGNFERVLALLERRHPLHMAVSHTPLGTDKLDYLARDARHTNDSVSLTLGALLNYTFILNNELVADISIIREVMQAQWFYSYMYDRVYLRRSALIAKHFFQKIVATRMASIFDPPLAEERLRNLVDYELDALLLTSSDPQVHALHRRLLNHQLPQIAIILRLPAFVREEHSRAKQAVTFAIAPELLTKFDHFRPRRHAVQLEECIAAHAGLSPDSVLLIPILHPERMIPPDITLYDNENLVGSLQELRPRHYQSLAETAEAHTAVLVCVFPEDMERITQPTIAASVHDELLALVSTL